jgi:matrixin
MFSVPSAAATVAPEECAQAPTPKRTSWRKLWFFTAVSALVGFSGARLLRAPESVSSRVHSGSPGFKTSKTGRDLHWAKKGITVYLDGSLARLGPTANEAVMQAFGQWVGSDPMLPALVFDTGGTSTEPKQDGKSTVSYGHITAHGHEHDVAITISYANDKTGEIVEADVILNALYPMGVLTAMPENDGTTEAVDCQNRYDAQNVATHEAGHFFGLGEDMTERRATMFLSINQCETHKRVLSNTDVGAVTTLYAASQDSEAAKPAGCSYGAAPVGPGALAVSGLVLGLGLLRRRSPR